MMQNHEIICEKVTTKMAGIFIAKLDDGLNHHRELVKKELEVIQLKIEKDVVSEIRKLKEELRRNGG